MASILQQSRFLLFLQLYASSDKLQSQDNSAHHLNMEHLKIRIQKMSSQRKNKLMLIICKHSQYLSLRLKITKQGVHSRVPEVAA